MNQHDQMDDMAEFASQLNTREGYHRHPNGCDYQGRYPQAAEACTELGADDEHDNHVSGVISVCVWLVIAFLAVAACWHAVEVLA